MKGSPTRQVGLSHHRTGDNDKMMEWLEASTAGIMTRSKRIYIVSCSKGNCATLHSIINN